MGVSSTNSDNEKESIWTSGWVFLVITTVVFAIWALNYYFMTKWFGQPDSPGTGGDLFGAATSLFSGLAFAGLIYTLFMQKQELKLQREQLKKQNEELKDTRKEFEIQRFESRFFGMIKLFNDHIQTIVVGGGGQQKRGRACLEQYARGLVWDLSQKVSDPQNNLQTHVDKFEKIYSDNEAQLGPYFRLLYNLFRQLEDQHGISNLEKKKHAAIIRAQLNSAELVLLLFNSVTVLGEPFKKWVEGYALFEHLPPDYAENFKHVINCYDPKAFGDRAHLFFDQIEKTAS